MSKHRTIFALLLSTAALSFLITSACRNRTDSPDVQNEIAPKDEPENYSATVVRSVEADGRRDESAIRMARSGDMLREEWTETGEKRALIWRPDMGKIFLLSLDRRLYVESDLIPELSETDSRVNTNGSDALSPIDAESIERAFDDHHAPMSVETRTLSDQKIEGQTCSVVEVLARFADGHSEMTRTFRSRDLKGLAIRIENESDATSVKILTERRDIKTEVSPDEFTVPSDFKKVESLSTR